MLTTRRVLAWLCSAAGFALIAATTMVPLPSANHGQATWFGHPSVSDILRNVILYMPLGFGLRQLGLRSRSSVMVGLALSALIEAAQISVITGRNASVTDVLSNTAGTAAGVWLAAHWFTILSPTAIARSRLFFCASGGLLAILVATAMGLRASLPGGRYRVRWAPQGSGQDWFHGQLLDACVAGTTLRNDSSPPNTQGAGGAAWLERGIVLTARFIPGKPLTEESSIVGIADSDNREIVELAQEGADLRFRVRTLATRVGLAAPTIVLRNALALSDETGSSDSMLVVAGMSQGRLELAATRRHERQSTTLALSPSLGWIALSPWQSWTATSIRFASAFWLVVVVFPVGYWGVWRRTQSHRDYVIAAIVFSFGLVAAPALAGTHLAMWWEWSISAAAIALGARARAAVMSFKRLSRPARS